MAQKTIEIEGIGDVLLQKRRGNRNIRLSIGHDGIVRVTMPHWTPYHVAEAFVRSKTEWLQKQKVVKRHHTFEPDEVIGKHHRLVFIHDDRSTITSRVTNSEVIIRLNYDHAPEDADVQAVVYKAAIRALKLEAKQELIPRLHALADEHGFSFNSVSVKQLKSRWGSCSSQRDIALNCYLMQLPWNLIDYVLLHELMHTRVMSHNADFWNGLAEYVPGLSVKRKAMRSYQPMLMAPS